tara:strand:+ start:701 stop:1186 length:486 start_codon:yes stop_codon:yes gene_type:complete
MENLQNLAGKIEELKEKLTDGEYKELLELTKECYDEKEEKAKRKFVKCLTGSFKLIINVEDDCDTSFFYTQGDKFNLTRDINDEGDLEVNIHRNIQFRETIFEVKCAVVSEHRSLNRKESWMSETFHEELKKNKYKKGHEADNEIGETGLCIIVYLHDIEL